MCDSSCRFDPEKSPLFKWLEEHGDELGLPDVVFGEEPEGDAGSFLNDLLHPITAQEYERMRLEVDAIDRKN